MGRRIEKQKSSNQSPALRHDWVLAQPGDFSKEKHAAGLIRRAFLGINAAYLLNIYPKPMASADGYLIKYRGLLRTRPDLE
jgi:hypothetical protein